MSKFSRFIKTIKQIYANRWILRHWINFRTYDYSYSYELMADMYRHMSEDFKHAPIENGKKYSTQLLKCSDACRRVARCEDFNNILIHKYEFLHTMKKHGLWYW